MIREYLAQRVERGAVQSRGDVAAALEDAGLEVRRLLVGGLPGQRPGVGVVGTGYGTGALSLTPDGASTLETGVSMTAVGTRGELVGSRATGGFSWRPNLLAGMRGDEGCLDRLREAGYRIRLQLIDCEEAVLAMRARYRNFEADDLVERQRGIIDQTALQAAKGARVELLHNRKGPAAAHAHHLEDGAILYQHKATLRPDVVCDQ